MDSQRSISTYKAPIFCWNEELLKTFVDVIVSHQLRYGKKQPYKWKDVAADFETKTHKQCTKETMRNKLESMKREYKAWTVLKKSETGLGWNPVTGRIDATDEWWERKIKEDAHCKKFRSKGMDPAYEELLIKLFDGQVATGRFAFSPSMDPSQLQQPETEVEVVADAHSGADGLGLGGDDFFQTFMHTVEDDLLPTQPDHIPPTNTENPTPNPPKAKRRRRQSVGSSKFEEHLMHNRDSSDKLISLMAEDISSHTNSRGLQFDRVMETLNAMVVSGHIEDGSDLWCFAVSICADKNYRGLFLSMRTPEQRINWLNFERRRRRDGTI